MTSFVDLADFKLFARIDGDDEDTSCQEMLEAATLYVTGFLDDASIPDTGDPASDDVQMAVKLIAAAWFANRETIVGTTSARERPQEIPYGAQDILRNLRDWTFG